MASDQIWISEILFAGCGGGEELGCYVYRKRCLPADWRLDLVILRRPGPQTTWRMVDVTYLSFQPDPAWEFHQPYLKRGKYLCRWRYELLKVTMWFCKMLTELFLILIQNSYHIKYQPPRAPVMGATWWEERISSTRFRDGFDRMLYLTWVAMTKTRHRKYTIIGWWQNIILLQSGCSTAEKNEIRCVMLCH